MAKRRTQDRWRELCEAQIVDDGLPVRSCGQWTEEKLRFWNRYIEITTSAMVDHPGWAKGLVYVDLFAGPGVCRVNETGKRLPGSPLIAASAPKSFRKILLCEKDSTLADACEHRLSKVLRADTFSLFRGDCNLQVDSIADEIPTGVLTLAFLDPEGLDVSFNTISKLAGRGRVDLLILVAHATDFVRNVESSYFAQENSKLDTFLGPNSDWRSKWTQMGNAEGNKARQFLFAVYRSQLQQHLGYIRFGEKTIRGPNGPLYGLLYASKHERGLDFWDKVTRTDSQGQREMFGP